MRSSVLPIQSDATGTRVCRNPATELPLLGGAQRCGSRASPLPSAQPLPINPRWLACSKVSAWAVDALAATIGRAVRAARMRRALSGAAAARLCGVSRSMLCRIEQGLCFPSVQVLCRIAEGLQVSPGSLLPAQAHGCGVVSEATKSSVASGDDSTRGASPTDQPPPSSWRKVSRS